MNIPKWMVIPAMVILAACAGTPSHRQTRSNETTRAPQQAVAANDNGSKPDDPDRVVCTYRKKLGSHFPQKECMTVRQMNKRQAEARREKQRRLGTHGGTSGGGD